MFPLSLPRRPPSEHRRKKEATDDKAEPDRIDDPLRHEIIISQIAVGAVCPGVDERWAPGDYEWRTVVPTMIKVRWRNTEPSQRKKQEGKGHQGQENGNAPKSNHTRSTTD